MFKFCAAEGTKVRSGMLAVGMLFDMTDLHGLETCAVPMTAWVFFKEWTGKSLEPGSHCFFNLPGGQAFDAVLSGLMVSFIILVFSFRPRHDAQVCVGVDVVRHCRLCQP